MRTLSIILSLVLLTVLALLPVDAKDVQVKGYTKKDGTVVKEHTRNVKDKDTVKVKGYTKKDGTVVAGYDRKKSSKSK